MSNKAMNKDYLLRQLQSFENDVLAQKSIATETGYHNFRYYNNKFSYKDGNTWTDVDFIVSLTQAQYNALSTAEKNKDVLYWITDAQSGGGLTAGTGIDITNDTISVKTASASQLGGIKVGTNLSIDANGVLSADAQSITVDDALDITSENPVENGVITAALGNKADNTSSFSDASTRTNIASGDTIPTILGKIKKWFTDLADLAFIAKDGNNSTKYLRGDGTWQTFPSLSTSLSGLTDTTITSVANKDILEYNDTSSKWENKKKFTALTATLTAGETELEITNEAITSTARIDVYFWEKHIPLLDQSRDGTTLTLTIPEQEENLNVKVLIYED